MKRLIQRASFFFLLICLIPLGAFAQNFYDILDIQDIRITFPYTNWDYRLDTAKQGAQGYLFASQCTVNGVVMDSVGVKYKGNSSYNANNAKNPMHIKLDHIINGQSYLGIEDIKLGNGFKDPSMLREVLAYKILRQYMHAPLSNFAMVHINGTFIGLYSNSQDINKAFAGEHFYSTDNAFFKCNPVYSGGNNPDLKYYGQDSTLYYGKYELQSDFGWADLIDLCDTLNNHTTEIETILDVDRAIWMLAFDNLTVNLDSYIGAIKQNYYLYRDNNPRFNPILWDLNECFGTFSNTGTGSPLDMNGLINLSPDLHLTDPNWPLIMRLLSDARYKRMYIAHMRTILEENFASQTYVTWAADLRTVIDSAVQADPNKFFTYSDFLNAMTQNVSGMGLSPGISNLMDSRVSYLQSLPEFQATPPSIQTPVLSDTAPAIGDSIWVTSTVGNATYVRLGYRNQRPDEFSYTEMFDDGNHGDGAASDGVYGAQMICNSGQMEYYVFADNSSAAAFSPARAEHEFYSLATSIPAIQPGHLAINEFMASNQTAVTDPAGEYADWLEIKNNTANDLNLYGLYLSDDALLPTKWAFPEAASIPANGYLIVWLDADEFQSGLHANFKLSATGESILLSYANGLIIDSTTFGQQAADISMQRCPDGTGPFVSASHTHAAANNCPTEVVNQHASPDLKLFPNPSNGIFTITGMPAKSKVQVFDATMKPVGFSTQMNGQSCEIDLGSYPSGIYFLQVNGTKVHKLIIAQ